MEQDLRVTFYQEMFPKLVGSLEGDPGTQPCQFCNRLNQINDSCSKSAVINKIGMYFKQHLQYRNDLDAFHNSLADDDISTQFDQPKRVLETDLSS